MNHHLLSKAADQARGLAMDAVARCHSGHLGLPLGCAELGAVLFGHALQIHPDQPKWINRDRFVLSAGHGSMFLYAWLHLSGFDLPLNELKQFRQLHSKTPGHPEFGYTVGVEATTGPLGQGIGNAVGLAMAAKMAKKRYNTKECTLLDHHVITLCGDGCMQEGIVSEASSLAGHLKLDDLIIIYDANEVTLDAMANKSQSENVSLRYQAYGFDVCTIDGHNIEALNQAIQEAKNTDNGKPKLIIIKTIIGKGIPEVQGTNKAHGEAGIKFVSSARKTLGLPEETFFVSEDVRSYFNEQKALRHQAYQGWQKKYEEWMRANPHLAQELEEAIAYKVPENLTQKITAFPDETKLATRDAGAVVLQDMAKLFPLLVSGSADLHGSTKNYIKEAGDFSPDNPIGRNIYFGIREHAMGAIINGFGYYGIFRASGATFLTFSDYMRPSVRLAALSHLPVFYIWTHDSVGVGEDGPTHQPIETVSSLRLIPNLDVIRPGDPEETAGAFIGALERINGPTALILSRQVLPNQHQIPAQVRRDGVLKGAYIAVKESGELKAIVIATGSELQHAIQAVKDKEGVRVVSMPSCERFDRQTKEYKEAILPSHCKKRIAIEAGVSTYWHKYIGFEGTIIGIDQFGISAPGDTVMEYFGIHKESIIKALADFGS